MIVLGILLRKRLHLALGLQHNMEDHHKVHTLWTGLWEEGFAVNRIWVQYTKDGSSTGPRPQPCIEGEITSAQWIGWIQIESPSPYRSSSASKKAMVWQKYQGEAIPRGILGTTLWFKIQGFQRKTEDKMVGTLHCGEMQWQWFSSDQNHWWWGHPHDFQWTSVESLQETPIQVRVYWRFE